MASEPQAVPVPAEAPGENEAADGELAGMDAAADKPKPRTLPSNGVMAALIKRVADALGSLEEMERKAEREGKRQPDVAEVIGPVSITLFALSCVGMLGVGFRVGLSRELDKHKAESTSAAAEEATGGSLRERLARQKAAEAAGQPGALKAPPTAPAAAAAAARAPAAGGLAGPQTARTVRGPSAPPTQLAMRALGYATVLTLSTATFVCIAGKWYFEIVSIEDLIWRLKHNVPKGSRSVQNVVGPPLESLRDSMQSFFKRFRPAIAPGQTEAMDATLEQERQELAELGVDSRDLLGPSKQQLEKERHDAAVVRDQP